MAVKVGHATPQSLTNGQLRALVHSTPVLPSSWSTGAFESATPVPQIGGWVRVQARLLPGLLLSPSSSHPQCLHHLRSGCSRGGNCPFMDTNKAGEDAMHRSAAAKIANKLDVSLFRLASKRFETLHLVRCIQANQTVIVPLTHHLELSAGNLVPRTQNTASDRDHRDH